MTSTSSRAQKRPHPDDDHVSEFKRSRSNNGSPAPQANADAGKPDISAAIALARAKAAAAEIARSKQGLTSSDSSSPTPRSAATGSGVSQSAAERLAAMKARVAAATAGNKALMTQRISTVRSSYSTPSYDDGLSKARGGLDVGLHPTLMADSTRDVKSGRGQSMSPRFSTTMGNRRTETGIQSHRGKLRNQLDLLGPSLDEIQDNPYYDASLGSQNISGKGRRSRQLIFNEQGKYAKQGAALRRQAALEAMKKRIAESSRKAGIDEDLDTEKAFLVEAPVDIEWWDEGLVVAKDYALIEDLSQLKLDSEDTIVTRYVQHPVPLEPPQDKNAPAPKPLPLTAHEQAKKRRQERAGTMKEQQAKIRLGLEPAPPPKVKLGNMMRVLGEEAVKDPTAVEARVMREIAERKMNHEEANEERKLTKDQRHDKVAQQQQRDAEKGIYASVYKIDSLVNGRHRFKIYKNAEQMALTGICILNPKFCLVIVEGGQKSIKNYKKLMLNRIKWDENDAPNREVREGNNQILAEWLNAEDAKGQLRDLSSNKCRLIWEGQERQRAFRKWVSRQCETDKDAREQLQRTKMDTYWQLAKNWPDEEF